jgi:hypothetical protein
MYVYLSKVKMIFSLGRCSAPHCINEILRLNLPKNNLYQHNDYGIDNIE